MQNPDAIQRGFIFCENVQVTVRLAVVVGVTGNCITWPPLHIVLLLYRNIYFFSSVGQKTLQAAVISLDDHVTKVKRDD